MTSPLPRWLQDHLVAQGHLAPGGITRHARVRRCRRCRVPVVSGLDDVVMADAVDVDPAPLGALAEAAALLRGCTTYDLARRAGKLVIDRRTVYEIQGWPPGTRRNVDVVKAHECGVQPQGLIGSTIEARRRYVLTDDPPF